MSSLISSKLSLRPANIKHISNLICMVLTEKPFIYFILLSVFNFIITIPKEIWFAGRHNIQVTGIDANEQQQSVFKGIKQ